MTTITPEIYTDIAQMLGEKLTESYVSVKIEKTYDEFKWMLEYIGDVYFHEDGSIREISPIWFTLNTIGSDGLCDKNDFEFLVFRKFIED